LISNYGQQHTGFFICLTTQDNTKPFPTRTETFCEIITWKRRSY